MKADYVEDRTFWPEIDKESPVPIYRQFVDGFVSRVKDGTYAPGLSVPSLNMMSGLLGISRETAYKSYHALVKLGFMTSRHGKGYFVNEPPQDDCLSLLVLLSEVNPNITTILSAFMERTGDRAKVTIQFHNQDPAILKRCIETEFGKYDYYLIFPHFNEDVISIEQTAAILRRIPAEKLIIMDRFLPGMGSECGMSYQYIQGDIQTCLDQVIPTFRKYNRLRSTPVYTSLYGRQINESLKLFCSKRHIPFEVANIDTMTIFKGDVFFIYGCSLGHAFVSLAEKINSSGLKVGSDVGIICYDDFQINEILFGGLTTLSTDYKEMGRAAADMVLSRNLRKVHCACTLECRGSF